MFPSPITMYASPFLADVVELRRYGTAELNLWIQPDRRYNTWRCDDVERDLMPEDRLHYGKWRECVGASIRKHAGPFVRPGENMEKAIDLLLATQKRLPAYRPS